MSKCAIIILMYRDSESTINLVKAVSQFNILDEIIVVDNCSPDDSYEKLKEYEADHIHVIQTTGNNGIAKGNNFGATYAKKICTDIDYFLFSNPDVIVTKESITDMIEFLDCHKNVAAVCPMELTKEKDYARDFAWKRPTCGQLMLTVMPITRRLYYRNKKEFLWFYDVEEAVQHDAFEAEVLISCFIMTKRSVFDEVGGFNEKTYLYHEEDLYAHKLYKNGKKLFVLMKHPIVHLGCSSMNKEYDDYEKINKLIVDSGGVYMSECLEIPPLGIWIYKMLYRISLIEKSIFHKFQKQRK